jgi:hypothetical protein
MSFLDKITDDVLRRDVDKLMTPIISRVLVYGFIGCSIFMAFCAYVNSNPLHKSEKLFWMPIEAYLFWATTLLIAFTIEKMYKRIVKKQTSVIAQKTEELSGLDKLNKNLEKDKEALDAENKRLDEDRKELLKKNFEDQEQIAKLTFDKDKTLLGNPPDIESIKNYYFAVIYPLIEHSNSESVTPVNLKLFEACIKSEIFTAYIKPEDAKLVYDRFFWNHQELKKEGYDQINWNNFVKYSPKKQYEFKCQNPSCFNTIRTDDLNETVHCSECGVDFRYKNTL